MSRGGSVSKRLYVHDPSMPRVPGRDTDIKITITNRHHLLLTKLDSDQHHDYKLTVTEPRSLDLPSFDDEHANEFMRQVIMACNLVMDRAAFSTGLSDSSHAEIDVGGPPPTTSKVESTPTGYKATVEDVVMVRDSLSVTVHSTTELDEVLVLDTLRKIRVVFGAGGKPPLKIHNIQKSLNAYLKGTQSTDESGAFGGMYESLEFAANFDRPNQVGGNIDAEVSSIMCDNTLPVKDLRLLNNRLKHPDTESERAKFDASKDKMTEKIRTLRPITSGVILRRLCTVT